MRLTHHFILSCCLSACHRTPIRAVITDQCPQALQPNALITHHAGTMEIVSLRLRSIFVSIMCLQLTRVNGNMICITETVFEIFLSLPGWSKPAFLKMSVYFRYALGGVVLFFSFLGCFMRVIPFLFQIAFCWDFSTSLVSVPDSKML